MRIAISAESFLAISGTHWVQQKCKYSHYVQISMDFATKVHALRL